MIAELTRFPIEIVDPRREGALEAYLDSGDLMLMSPVSDRLKLVYGALISAPALIFDIDESQILAEVELGIEEKLWRKRKVDLTPPVFARRGSIRVHRAAIEQDSFDELVPEVWTDRDRSHVVIELEPIDERTQWVKLSDSCYALVNDGFLAGFVARL